MKILFLLVMFTYNVNGAGEDEPPCNPTTCQACFHYCGEPPYDSCGATGPNVACQVDPFCAMCQVACPKKLDSSGNCPVGCITDPQDLECPPLASTTTTPGAITTTTTGGATLTTTSGLVTGTSSMQATGTTTTFPSKQVDFSLQVLDYEWRPLEGVEVDLVLSEESNGDSEPSTYVTDSFGQTEFLPFHPFDVINYKLTEELIDSLLRVGTTGTVIVSDPPDAGNEPPADEVGFSHVETVGQPLAERVTIAGSPDSAQFIFPAPTQYPFWELQVPKGSTASGVVDIGMLIGSEVKGVLGYHGYAGDASLFDRALMIHQPVGEGLPTGETGLYIIMFDYDAGETYKERNLSIINFGGSIGDFTVAQPPAEQEDIPEGQLPLRIDGSIPGGHTLLLWSLPSSIRHLLTDTPSSATTQMSTEEASTSETSTPPGMSMSMPTSTTSTPETSTPPGMSMSMSMPTSATTTETTTTTPETTTTYDS